MHLVFPFCAFFFHVLTPRFVCGVLCIVDFQEGVEIHTLGTLVGSCPGEHLDRGPHISVTPTTAEGAFEGTPRHSRYSSGTWTCTCHYWLIDRRPLKALSDEADGAEGQSLCQMLQVPSSGNLREKHPDRNAST